MNSGNINIEFRHRRNKPSSPTEGYFYWVETDDNNQIWFAPDGNPDNMVLLSNEVSNEIISRIENAEGNISSIQEILNQVREDLSGVDSDIDSINERLDDIEESIGGFATKEDLENIDVDLTDSDYDIIAEKVNESFKLTWKEI